MDELKTLAKLVTYTNNIRTMLPLPRMGKGKEELFYSNLLCGKYSNDNDAAQDLYGSDSGDVRYKMLKHRLRKKLFNQLLFANYSRFSTSDFYQKEHECFGLIYKANVLLRNKELNLVLPVSSKALNIAREYELTNLAIAALEFEAFYYSEAGLHKKYLKTEKELRLVLRQKAFEREAVSILQKLKVTLSKSIKVRSEVLPTLQDVIKRLFKLWQLSKTFEAFNAYYKASMLLYEMSGDFPKITELTLLSERWVKEKKVNSRRFDANFNRYILVYAHLRAKKLQEGLDYAQKFIIHFSEDSLNWFAFMENYYLLSVYLKNYELAGNLLFKVNQNPVLKKISNAAKERWLLYETYLSLFLGKNYQHFKASNPFVLSLPEYSKDKQGYNVAILILQFIYFLQKDDTESLLFRIESLKKYIHTHLKDSFSSRSKLFLKLLILVVTEDFDPNACQKKGEKLYNRLIQEPTPGDAYAEIEIVPYEHLWDFIMKVLVGQKVLSKA
ncbi:hypothetical protein CLV24_12449 [Pontibacter ummariensis]|uniref:Uncharacterized protein n=1 Tax=Pontibacter ummariensis TaxID=1610492 RepID=A0A239JVL3_9BACT|nr:hypothetical protein [Pontibacter ummariensis]PRY07311.1 hypothetical protein CLV24_12449 [Pontibacter ummariensis]SNT09901.1 hypothetical protein SAMN06296052_12415 [Pontibacter ummariensis]